MQSLERILAILDSTSRSASSVSASTVAEETGLSISTVVRIMQALVEEQVLVRSAGTGQYRIGPRLVGVVSRATGSFDYRAAAQPLLDRLRDATQETASLHVLQDDRRICIAAAYTTLAYGRIVPIGLPFPVVGSAAGHALLSQLADAELDRTLAAVCDSSQLEEVRAAVAEVRREGLAVSVNHSVAGVRGMAVPVGSTPGLGCLSVSGPSARFDEAAAEKALSPLRDAVADLVSLRLPGPPRGPAAGALDV